ncbi:META domain-containing protein [Sulfitobacter guttiformis]|uniref:Heat shock protein HslJ n=1 Tax=Sulfitobacter guttiformis TaxID=74349 RepID=A0A420DQY7_9RHOB|nr:META domain-containing protein [Sulfitobacter guttiformis]KIN73946.1 META domain containing protein [Sulfitobacter guttiformis KCTC 32187]RKE96573.1 heat shock protein HslJ [Sulfitobacter guttiformis]
MKKLLLLSTLLTVLVACRSDETVRAYGAGDRIWTLKLLNDVPFPATATLTFPKTGEIAGQGPCNRYFGAMKVPYPWFDAGPIGSTRMACPDFEAETAFLQALEAATLSDVLGDTLILSNTEGLEMVFKATD